MLVQSGMSKTKELSSECKKCDLTLTSNKVDECGIICYRCDNGPYANWGTLFSHLCRNHKIKRSMLCGTYAYGELLKEQRRIAQEQRNSGTTEEKD